MAKSKHGTRLHGVPPAEHMRSARRLHPLLVISDGRVDPAIGALRAVLANISVARSLAPRQRGRPLNIAKLVAALDALEKARVPLRCHVGSQAERVLTALPPPHRMPPSTARAVLRRLVDLRGRIGCDRPRPICLP